jgi:hypothetical protein
MGRVVAVGFNVCDVVVLGGTVVVGAAVVGGGACVVTVRRCVVVGRGAWVTVGAGATVVSGGGGTVVVVVGASVVVVVSAGAAPGTVLGGVDGTVCVMGESFEASVPVIEKAAARKTVPDTKRIEAHTVVSARLFEDLALSPPPKGFRRLTGEKKVDI